MKDTTQCILDAAKNGTPLKHIEVAYNIKRYALRTLLEEHGISRYGRLTQATIDSVSDESDKHFTYTSVAKKVGIHADTLREIIKKYNITCNLATRPERIKSLTVTEQLDEVVHDIEALVKISVNRCASELGFSWQTILNYCADNNISYNTVTRYSMLSDEEIASITHSYLYTTLSKKDIAEKYNIGSSVLNKLIAAHGLEKKNQADKDFIEYRRIVRALTYSTIRLYKLKTPPGMHWDHRISVYDGYQLNVAPCLISSYENLKCIDATENLKKGTSSSISTNDLLLEVSNWKKTNLRKC